MDISYVVTIRGTDNAWTVIVSTATNGMAREVARFKQAGNIGTTCAAAASVVRELQSADANRNAAPSPTAI